MTCVHVYVRLLPSGSLEAEPFNVTVPPSSTVAGVAVADAVGAWLLMFWIVILVDLLSEQVDDETIAVTDNVKCKSIPESTSGAVKDNVH